MSSAVGPVVVDAGLVQAEGDRAEVRIFNTNTRRIITSRFLLKDGKAAVEGDAEIYGVPDTGSPIWLSFECPGGGRTDKLFPAGNKIDIFDIPGFGPLPVTVIDCDNPVVLFRAADLGLTGCELSELHKDGRIMEIIETVRRKAAGIATAAAAKISGTVASGVLRPGHTAEAGQDMFEFFNIHPRTVMSLTSSYTAYHVAAEGMGFAIASADNAMELEYKTKPVFVVFSIRLISALCLLRGKRINRYQ